MTPSHCFVSYNMFTVQHDKGVTDSQGGHCILGSSDPQSLDPIGFSDRGSLNPGVTVSSDTGPYPRLRSHAYPVPRVAGFCIIILYTK